MRDISLELLLVSGFDMHSTTTLGSAPTIPQIPYG